MAKEMTKYELIDEIAEKACCTKLDARNMLNAFIDTVTEQLVQGNKIKLIGFGTFEVRQRKAGEAALAKATQDRQIKVQEAEAEQEAASKQAEANRILGESIRQYPESMEQKWVEAIEKTSNQVIYLPTEASIPITESARMAQKAKAEK